MKILHTADWHLGKRLEHVSRLPEQHKVLEEIVEIANREEVDVVLIAGDLFDTYNPPTEAVDLFYQTLKKLAKDGERAVFAIAGNHDSPDRIEAPDPLARECGIFFAGYPHTRIRPIALDTGLQISQSDEGFVEVFLPDYDYPLRLLLTPYANEHRLKTFLGIRDTDKALNEVLHEKWQALYERYCNSEGLNILLSHLFFTKKGETPPEEPEGEKPINHVGGASAIVTHQIPKGIDYTALGHLHAFREVEKSPCPVIYSSSPLTYSFQESRSSKKVVILKGEPGKTVDYRPIPLNTGFPLVQKKLEGIDTAVDWLQENQECWVDLTLVTDDFISGKDRKRLYDTHSGIINIIPEVKNATDNDLGKSQINLQKDMESLFQDYFTYKQGQPPDRTMLDLFREMLGSDSTDDQNKRDQS